MSYLIIAFIALGIAVAQAGVGGMKLLYSLPAYGIVGLAALCSLFQYSRRVSVGARAACLASALALAGCVVVRSHLSPVDYLARHDLFMTLGALTVYLLAATFLSECRQRVVLVVILLVFAGAHLWRGVLQFGSKTGQSMLFSPWIERTDYAYRASGFYLSPNHLAGLMEMLGLMAVALACWSNWRLIYRMMAGYAALICFIGVAITGSRGGYVSTLAGLLIFAGLSMAVVWRLRPPRFWLLLAFVLMLFAGLVGGGVTLMLKSQMLQDRLGRISNPDAGRLAMWDAALKQFALSPLTGTGSGTYLLHGRQFRTAPIDRDPAHVQNDYLELLCEYGVVGSAAMALFLGVHIWSGLAGMRCIVAEMEAMGWGALNDELALLTGALSAIAALLVHSVFDSNVHVPGNTLVMAFLFSILAAPTIETLLPEESIEPSPVVYWLRFLAPAIGLYLLVVGVPRVEGEYDAECASRALHDEDYADAARWAESGIVVEKMNPHLFHRLAVAKHSMAKLREQTPGERFQESHEVIGALRAGLELSPNDARLLLSLARVLDDYGRFQEAEPVFAQAIKADPSFHFAQASYGMHFQLQNMPLEAGRHYRRAIALGEPPDGLAAKSLREMERQRNIESDKTPSD